MNHTIHTPHGFPSCFHAFPRWFILHFEKRPISWIDTILVLAYDWHHLHQLAGVWYSIIKGHMYIYIWYIYVIYNIYIYIYNNIIYIHIYISIPTVWKKWEIWVWLKSLSPPRGTAAWQWAPCRKPAHGRDQKWVRKIPKDDQQSKGWGIQTSVDSLDYI